MQLKLEKLSDSHVKCAATKNRKPITKITPSHSKFVGFAIPTTKRITKQ